MTPDISDTDDDRSTGPKTFRPPVDDYFRKRVRDDHAPNAALHAAIKAAAEDDDRIHSVNLMGSHAPGNSHKGEPRYNVRVDVRNEGMGHPVLGATVVGRLVDRGDVRITGVVECSDDHLVVALRPIETRVEPVEVPYRYIPDDAKGVSEQTVAAVLGDAEARLNEEFRSVSPVRVFRDVVEDYGDALPEPDVDGADDRLQALDVRLDEFPSGWRDQKVGPAYLEDGYDDVVHYAKKVLRHAIEEEGSNGRTYEAARVLATFLYMVDPEADEDHPSGTPYLDDLLSDVDHDFGWEESPDGCVEYVTFPDLDTPCVTYECSTTATDSVRYQFPSGYVVDVPVCDDHADDFGRDLLSPPWQEDDTYHTITFGDGKDAPVPEFKSSHDAVDFAAKVIETFAQDYHIGDLVGHVAEAKNGWGYACTDTFQSFDMRRYTFDVFNRAYGRHRDDSGDVSTFPPEDDDGFEPYSTRRARRHDVDVALQDRDDGSIVAKVEGEKAGEWHKVDTGRGIYNVRVDVDDDRTTIPCGCGDYDVMVPSGVTPPKIDVVCPSCRNHFGHGVEPTEPCPCDHDHDEPRSMAEATASGLGLAAVAESIAREDDGDGVAREDSNLSDEAIGKALAKGVVSFTEDGRLVDTRDVVRDDLADAEGGTDE